MSSSGHSRVLEFLALQKMDITVRVLEPESTRTSQAAADKLGCKVAEIAKTIGFLEGKEKPLLVVLSGDRRVNLALLEREISRSEKVIALKKMTAGEVKSHTGYSIGGVPPFPHDDNVMVLVDRSLFRFPMVWAAAGTSNSVMQFPPAVLTEQMKYRLVNVSTE